jgi:hypothetical protein
LLGATTDPDVVNDPEAAAVSDVDDDTVIVGEYVVEAVKPVIERLVAVVPVYGVEGAEGMANE